MVTATLDKSQDKQNMIKSNSCPVSSILPTQAKVTEAIEKLLEQGIERDEISVIGKNFQSETRIAGFITRKDVILDGLKNGAIFGSLFGTFLSLLSGVGILFIPFVGSVVAAGPLGSALLGATSGAIAGSAGFGLASVLASLGMPEEKAAIYQTRLKAGKFLLMVEVLEEKVSLVESLLKSIGGEDIAICPDMIIPKHHAGQIQSAQELSPEIFAHLTEEAQQQFIQEYNQAYENSESETEALTQAWQHIEENFTRNAQGIWANQTA